MSQMKLAALSTILFASLCCSAVAQQQESSPATTQVGEAKQTSDGVSSSLEYTENTQAIRIAREIRERKPVSLFSTVAVGFRADTLGLGVDVATPLSRSFNLRVGADFIAFNYPFVIDGVYYDARIHLQSGRASLDWFPRHGGFHISPGILYFKNALSAPSSVPAGDYFELGDQGFTNSTNDPVKGTANAVFPHKFAPMLAIGFGNLIPRSGRHFSFPFEVGVAYTGAAQINVTLNGTACVPDGCVNFANNAEAKSDLLQEISKLNEDLKKVPVYPIVSMGVAYRF